MRGQNKNNVVMIADDDLFVRKVIRAALRDFAEVVEVADGADVQACYAKHLPDIVFLDIHLPNISGLEVIRSIRKRDLGAHIVMLSADSCIENVRASRFNGSKGFLTKPFEKKRILQLFNACPTVKFIEAQSIH